VVIEGETGSSRYLTDYRYGSHRLLVAVFCRIADGATPSVALLDTGSEWCVLPPEVAQESGFDLMPDPATAPLHTRFGLIYGRLERVTITLIADQGHDLDVPATCFLSEDWPGPLVLGWKGFLERIRFSVDPNEEPFYFASL